MSETHASSVRIEPVLTSAERSEFVDLPYRLYRDDPAWVAPLRTDQHDLIDPGKNAFFEHGHLQAFLARDEGGGVVGRIAAIVNGMHLQEHGDATGFFGFFDAVDDYAVTEALLDRAARWLKDQGLVRMRGPTNPTMMDTAGVLVDGFDRRPALLMPFNAPYYPEHLERYGLDRAMTMWAYYIHKKYMDRERLRRGADLVRRRTPEVSSRTVRMDEFDAEAERIRSIYNDAWSENWGYVPLTEAEFDQLAEEMEQIVDPVLVHLLEVEDEPVAFAVALPDLNEVLRYVRDGRLFPTGLLKLLLYTQLFDVSSCRMALMGVRKKYQGRGFGTLLVHETVEHGIPAGYDECELSWVLDSNRVMINQLEAFGAVRDKEYAMYETEIV